MSADKGTARRYVADFPLSKAGLLDWEFIAVEAPLPLEYIYDAGIECSPAIRSHVEDTIRMRDDIGRHQGPEA
jgi:hypothetical protein